ncbi:MAG TPA: hypothetical protein VJX92_15065 [Methylomirabilota bacterium]|nr:hypothetical protein [Methylomirabilota bacterium]
MQYWEVVTRSFRIAWNHKYLWLIALFSGEAGGGYSFNFNPQGPSTSTGGEPSQSTAQIQQQITTWLNDHAGLIVVLAALWLVLVVAFFILGAICEGATVRASAEHDAERPFGLGWAWRSGMTTLGAVVRFRLILLLLYLPLLLVLVGLGASIAVAVLNRGGGAVGVIFLFAILALLGIPYAIYLFFLDRLGLRALVLEQLGARASFARGHRLLFKRLGRTLLVWLLSIAVGFALGIGLACVGTIAVLPFVLIGAGLAAANSAALVPVIILAVIILLPLFLVVGGFLAAQSSTYWTLAFRRLDLDPVPMPGYLYQPAPQPPQATP